MRDIKRQLIEIAKKEKLDIDKTFALYVREGLLDRLSRSKVADRFILKGASVFQVLEGRPHRPTADIDLLGFGTNEPQKLEETFTEICRLPLADGLNFQEISTEIVQKGQKYQGVRLKIRGTLDNIPFTSQIDVGYGHTITPAPQKGEFPTLLGRIPPKIRIYPKETIVAEKLEALVSLGVRNSRLKDYYDLLYLARKARFRGSILTKAITNTFNRRETPLPAEIPVGLTEEYLKYKPQRSKLWKKLYSEGIMGARPQFSQALAEIREFLVPPLQAAAKNARFDLYWSASEKWQPKSLYEIYSEGVKDIGLSRSKQIAINAFKDGVEREQVVEMMKTHDPDYQKLASQSGDKIAERTVVSRAEVEIMQSQMSQSEQQSQSVKVAKSRRKSL